MISEKERLGAWPFHVECQLCKTLILVYESIGRTNEFFSVFAEYRLFLDKNHIIMKRKLIERTLLRTHAESY